MNLLIVTISLGQDIITRTDGTQILGKVTGEDSTHIFVKTVIKDKEIEAAIMKNKVAQILYENAEKPIKFNKKIKGLLNIEEGFWGYKYYKDDKKVTYKEFHKALKPHDKIYNEYKKSIGPRMLSNVTGIIGGYFIGRSLGKFIVDKGKKFDTSSLALGGGFILISIPFSGASLNKKKEAVSMYNEMIVNKNSLGYQEDVRLSIKGLGLYVDF